MEKVRDINLTLAGGTGRSASKIVCRGRIDEVFGIVSTLFYGVWCRIERLLCIALMYLKIKER